MLVRMRWVGHSWQERIQYKVLIENPEGKTSLGIPRYRWKDNINMDGWLGFF
jgi:type 1 glutamine amidotransferase